jgi:Mg/Co/Ni transporter MgtE
MGFTDVYDYAAGKADWIAMGLPTEHRDTRKRIEEVARTDAPTCSVHDRIGQVRAELPEGWNACVVLNTDRIVLGLAELPADSNRNQSIEEIMRPAPLTFRPGRTVEETCEYLQQKNIAVALVTTSIGQFIGVLRRDELCREQ